MPQTTIDVAALFISVEAKRQVEELSWRELAGLLQISPSTFTRLAQGRRPDVDTFATLLAWLQDPVEKFSRAAPPSETDDALPAVSLFFRGNRNPSDADVDAYEDVIRAAASALER